MSIEAEEKIRTELARDEHLLWSGIPRQGLCLRPVDVLLIPFSLMWGSFMVFWEVSSFSAHTPLFFKLFGIPFLLFGVYFVIGRFFVDSYQRSRTWYGVTDRRVVLLTNWRNRSVKSISLKGLNDISSNERKDGSGTITLGTSPWMYSGWFGPWWPGVSSRMPPTLDLIPDVRKVYELIRDVQQRESARSTPRTSAPTGLPDLDSRRT